MKIISTIFAFILLLLLSIALFLDYKYSKPIQEEKCVTIVDKNNKPLNNVIASFFVRQERNNDDLGGLITKLDLFRDFNMGKTDINGKVCFSNFPKKDSSYIFRSYLEICYTNFRKSFLQF